MPRLVAKDDQITPASGRLFMNTKLKFAFEKETKGAVRYQEVGDDGTPAFAPQVGTLYVRKSAMPSGKIPKTLIVTITGE
jgi:hypothetical protein